MPRKLKPVTPGELLWEEFLLPLGITKYRVAKEIGVPAQRIGEIVAGRRAISADTDLRLCRFFGLSNGYWLRAQAARDMEIAAREIAAELKRWHRAKARAQHRQVAPHSLEGEAQLIGNRLLRCVLLRLGSPRKSLTTREKYSQNVKSAKFLH